MGMNIDFSKPLSDKEKAHLRERSQEYKVEEAATPAAKQTEEEQAEGYADWTKDELKAELKERGLTVGGSVDELVQRLEEDDAASEEE